MAVSSGPVGRRVPGKRLPSPLGGPVPSRLGWAGEAPLAQAGGCSGPGPWGTPPCRRAWCGCASARGSGLRVQVAVRPLPGHTPRVWPDTREPGRRGVRRASERALSPGTTCQSPGSCHAPQGLQGASGKTGRPPPVCRRLSRRVSFPPKWGWLGGRARPGPVSPQGQKPFVVCPLGSSQGRQGPLGAAVPPAGLAEPRGLPKDEPSGLAQA